MPPTSAPASPSQSARTCTSATPSPRTPGTVAPTPTGGVTDPNFALFASVQTFPLSYQSPLARVSIRIYPKLRWNVGWQFYDYHQQFNLLGYYQNFHAQTGYTSVTWAF